MSALCLHGNGNGWQSMAALDPLLARVVELWPAFSADVRKTICAMCVDAVLLGSPARDTVDKSSNDSLGAAKANASWVSLRANGAVTNGKTSS